MNGSNSLGKLESECDMKASHAVRQRYESWRPEWSAACLSYSLICQPVSAISTALLFQPVWTHFGHQTNCWEIKPPAWPSLHRTLCVCTVCV